MAQSLIDVLILKNTWQFLKTQLKTFDVWLGFSCLVILRMLGIVLFGGIVGIGGMWIVAKLLTVISTESSFYIHAFAGAMGCALVAVGLAYFARMFIVVITIVKLNALDVAQNKPMLWFNYTVPVLQLVGVGLLYYAMLMVGCICLIIPGIFLGVRFSLASYIVLDRNCGVFEALQESWHITRNYFWTLLIVNALLYLLYLIPFMFLINVFFPIVQIVGASVYVQLRQKQYGHSEI